MSETKIYSLHDTLTYSIRYEPPMPHSPQNIFLYLKREGRYCICPDCAKCTDCCGLIITTSVIDCSNNFEGDFESHRSDGEGGGNRSDDVTGHLKHVCGWQFGGRFLGRRRTDTHKHMYLLTLPTQSGGWSISDSEYIKLQRLRSRHYNSFRHRSTKFPAV